MNFVDRFSLNQGFPEISIEAIHNAIENAKSCSDNYNYHYLNLINLINQTDSNEIKEILEITKNLLVGSCHSYETVSEYFSNLDISNKSDNLQKSLNPFIQKNKDRIELTSKLGVKYFPRIHSLFSSIENACDFYLMNNMAHNKIITNSTLVLSVGSCFARNIGSFLQKFSNSNVYYVSTGEELDSLSFLKFSERFQEAHPEAAKELENSEQPVIFYTIGITETLKDKNNKEFSIADAKSNPVSARGKHGEIKDPNEIASEIKEAFKNFQKINKDIKFIITVSPVPLEASFQKGQSIITADCLSKSTLRYATSLVEKTTDNTYYFPSFEAVKWLSPLLGLQPYAEDDGHPRHVSNKLVIIICLIFLKYFADTEIFESCQKNLCKVDDVPLYNFQL